MFTNEPDRGSGQAGSCFGDSLGPVFDAGTHQVAAIVPYVHTLRIGPDMPFRIDNRAAPRLPVLHTCDAVRRDRRGRASGTKSPACAHPRSSLWEVSMTRA